MASFGKKKKMTEYLYSKPSIVVLVILIVFLSIAVFERYRVERQMSERRMETEQNKQELIKRQRVLEDRVEYLAGERGIEEEIRKHFDVAKEGEKVIILVGDDAQPSTTSEPTVEDKPWYQFW